MQIQDIVAKKFIQHTVIIVLLRNYIFLKLLKFAFYVSNSLMSHLMHCVTTTYHIL